MTSGIAIGQGQIARAEPESRHRSTLHNLDAILFKESKPWKTIVLEQYNKHFQIMESLSHTKGNWSLRTNNLYKLVLIVLPYGLVFLKSVICQDIVGCGGFVQSKVPLNFERVEIKLYTKQGALKFKTECAPNNGYFLVAVYDKVR